MTLVRGLLAGMIMTIVIASGTLASLQNTPAPGTIWSSAPDLAQEAASPEQQLIEKYAPIVALKNQEGACDDNGEPFYPVAVDVVFGKDDVVLKRATGSSSSSDEVIMSAPSAADLYAKGDGYYIDLPGNPRHPGCGYEQWFDLNSAGYEPMAYAHIVTGGERLVVQYWFFYVFNNFNNTHESDWEMMQVFFDVGSVEQALQTEPVQVAVAQHGGGETADWNDSKFQRDGNRPIVFSAAGSHSTQYGDAVYLGWGENGTGFGCDITTGPSTLVPLNVTLLPSFEPDPASEFAWLNFEGRWGERQEGEFNGPTGPATKRSWSSPFLWQEGLRSSSIEVPLAETAGPAPTDVFCTLSAAGSNLFRVIGDNSVVLLSSVIGILAVIVAATRYIWPTVRAAFGIYRRQWRTFTAIGLWLVPVGILFNGFQYLVSNYPPGSTVIGVVGKTPESYYALAILTLIAQLLASLVVVGPMTIAVYEGIERGETISFRQALQLTIDRAGGLLKAIGLMALVTVALATVVLTLPVAIWLLVRWCFVSQATVLDDADTRGALNASSNAVRGRWWRIALVNVSLFIVACAPGVLVGLGLLVFGSATVQTTNAVSSVLYVVSVPLAILGLTVVYRRRDLTPELFQWLRKVIAKVRRTPSEESVAPAG
jgi:hypothetical protein